MSTENTIRIVPLSVGWQLSQGGRVTTFTRRSNVAFFAVLALPEASRPRRVHVRVHVQRRVRRRDWRCRRLSRALTGSEATSMSGRQPL
jgi:hypothetical protein